jgi:hypothetical protein
MDKTVALDFPNQFANAAPVSPRPQTKNGLIVERKLVVRPVLPHEYNLTVQHAIMDTPEGKSSVEREFDFHIKSIRLLIAVSGALPLLAVRFCFLTRRDPALDGKTMGSR